MAALQSSAAAALQSAGETAVGLVRAQMESGYGRPIRRTGALMADVSAAADQHSLSVGNSLSYSVLVHGGTARMAARPYLADALSGGAAALMATLAEGLDPSL